jgi:hypothetical protein
MGSISMIRYSSYGNSNYRAPVLLSRPAGSPCRQLIELRERVRQAEAAASKRFTIATRKRIRRSEDESAVRHLLDARGGVRGVQRQGCNHQSQLVERGRDALVAGLGEKRAVAGTTTALNGPRTARASSVGFPGDAPPSVFPEEPRRIGALCAVAESPPSGFHRVALLWSNRRWGVWTCPI